MQADQETSTGSSGDAPGKSHEASGAAANNGSKIIRMGRRSMLGLLAVAPLAAVPAVAAARSTGLKIQPSGQDAALFQAWERFKVAVKLAGEAVAAPYPHPEKDARLAEAEAADEALAAMRPTTAAGAAIKFRRELMRQGWEGHHLALDIEAMGRRGEALAEMAHAETVTFWRAIVDLERIGAVA